MTYNVPPFRAWNKTTKKMYHSVKGDVAFILTKSGFAVTDFDSGNLNIETLHASDEDSVLMHGVNFRDKHGKWIYEGDLIFFKRRTHRGFIPVIGIVNRKDFTFGVNTINASFTFDYGDADLEVLGNIVENSDEELAALAEKLLKPFEKKEEDIEEKKSS